VRKFLKQLKILFPIDDYFVGVLERLLFDDFIS
jgi:hypothetical protein